MTITLTVGKISFPVDPSKPISQELHASIMSLDEEILRLTRRRKELTRVYSKLVLEAGVSHAR